MAKLSAKVPSLGAIRTSPCPSWDTPPSGGRTSRMRSVSATAKTPSLIPSVRSVRYLRSVFSLSSFGEPSPLMNSPDLPPGEETTQCPFRLAHQKQVSTARRRVAPSPRESRIGLRPPRSGYLFLESNRGPLWPRRHGANARPGHRGYLATGRPRDRPATPGPSANHEGCDLVAFDNEDVFQGNGAVREVTRDLSDDDRLPVPFEGAEWLDPVLILEACRSVPFPDGRDPHKLSAFITHDAMFRETPRQRLGVSRLFRSEIRGNGPR